MLNGLRRKVTVKPGGLIEFRSPELPDGAVADVIVILESPAEQPKSSLVSLIGAAKGSFATPLEVDEFIRQEREAWDS